MKLEQLLPYMPYGLQIKILNHKCDYVGIEYSIANGYYLIGDRLHITYNGGSTGKDIDTFKPILRPMSDFWDPSKSWMQQVKEIDNSIEFWSGEFDSPCNLPYVCFEVLIRNHFDVFDLLSQNLAISIHDLEK